MMLVWPLLAAFGLLLFVSGLPLWTRSSLRRRVEPYVGGLHGRPSALLRSRSRWNRRATALLERGWVGVPPDLAARLESSGSGLDVATFRMEQLAWALVAAVGVGVSVIAASWMGASVDLRVAPLLVAILFCAGWLGRDWWLSRQIARRHAALRAELPAAIDLITLSIMAGESVAAACARVARVLPTEMGAEFARVTGDVRAGAPIVEALEDLGRRVPEVGVGRFVDALCTGIEKGAPLAETLRAQADDGREARRRYLLEVGGRREVLMLIPVVFLIMPVVVVFALYPGLVTLELLVP